MIPKGEAIKYLNDRYYDPDIMSQNIEINIYTRHIEKAIDIALEEQTKNIFNDLERELLIPNLYSPVALKELKLKYNV